MRSKLGRTALLGTAMTLSAAFAWAPGAAQASVPKCFGKAATIVSNKAVIKGTKHADVIVAGGHANTIYGYGGADLICAGGGNDAVFGGAGPDKINGGTGADKVIGGGGDDTILGGGGSDGIFECFNPGTGKFVFNLAGGGGDDTIGGGAGNDCIAGGPGQDKLSGNGGDDVLMGGLGSDTLNGGNNGNPLNPATPNALGDTATFIDLANPVNANLTTGHAHSGSDNDTMTGIENLFGTSHNDTLKGNHNSALPNGPVNGLEGGPGNDTINGNGGHIEIGAFLLSAGPVTATTTGPNVGGPGLDGTATGEGSDTLTNLTGIAGSSFGDTITWGGIVFGGPGDDHIHMFAGTQVNAGAGDDTVDQGGFDDGTADTVTGGDGNDHITTGTGDDQVAGGNGDDVMDGGAGTDSGDGGPGTDSCANFETAVNCEA